MARTEMAAAKAREREARAAWTEAAEAVAKANSDVANGGVGAMTGWPPRRRSPGLTP